MHWLARFGCLVVGVVAAEYACRKAEAYVRTRRERTEDVADVFSELSEDWDAFINSPDGEEIRDTMREYVEQFDGLDRMAPESEDEGMLITALYGGRVWVVQALPVKFVVELLYAWKRPSDADSVMLVAQWIKLNIQEIRASLYEPEA
jgi:hypothetical protein